MDEFGIRFLYPAPRGGVNFIGKNAHGNRDGDVLGGEKGKLVFPIQTSRRDPRVRQPVEGDVVEDVVPRKALGLTGKDACHHRLTRCVVIDHPGRQSNRRICKPVQSLRAVRHLHGVTEATRVEKRELIVRVLLAGCGTSWGGSTCGFCEGTWMQGTPTRPIVDMNCGRASSLATAVIES